MSTIELNTYKMELLREIMNGFNSETALRKLGTACHLIKNEEEAAPLSTMPSALLQELMETAATQDVEGRCITNEELEKEMATW